MANRSTLIIAATPEYSSDRVGTGILAWNYSFAVLWFALFRVEDLKYLRHEQEDGVYMIPYLVSSAEEAKSNLKRRKESLLPLLTPSGGVRGLHALEAAMAQASGFVILDTWEIVSLGMKDSFLTQCIQNIDALNLEPVLEQAYIRQSVHSFRDYGEGGDDPQPYIGYPWVT
jgi:hypothetical protein